MARARRPPWCVSLFVAAALEMVLSWASPAWAGAVLADRTFTFTATNDDNKKSGFGYYVFVPNVTKDQIDVAKSGGTILNNVRVNPAEQGKKGVTVFFENPANGVAVGKESSFNLYIKNVKADLTFGTSGFRDGAGATGKPIGTATFDPTAEVKGDPSISFVQNSDQAVDFQIHNLQYLVNVDRITDTFSLLDLNNSFGFQQAPIPDLSVASMDMQSIVQTLPPVADGKWMYVRGELNEQGMTSTFVEGFYYVPEPSSAVLLGLGAVGTYIFVRRARTSGGSAAKTGQ